MNKINSIQVLGSGCPTCKKLFDLTQQAVAELNLNTKLKHITDIQKIIELGLMSSPVLTVNGKVVLIGQLPSLKMLKELLTSNCQTENEESKSHCSCNGKC